MPFVERLEVNEETTKTILYDEHLVRYYFAAECVKNKKVLDVASGSGYGAALLSDAGAFSVIGVDIDQEAIEKAKKAYHRTNLQFKQSSATALPLADKSIDIITSFETIEHINDYQSYLRELSRVLADDGLAFISTPNKAVYHEESPFHIKEFTKEEFIEALRKHFSFVQLFEQKNGLASVLTTEDAEEGTVIMNNQNIEALYFIAVCSKQEIDQHFKTTASVNTLALKNWENNPGWKLVNFIYKLFHR